MYARTYASELDGQMLNKLSAAAFRNLKTPGRYGDGGGLWLQVQPSRRAGAVTRSWLFRFATPDGKGHWMGLGSADDVSLAEAREKARNARREIAEGGNPLKERRKAKEAAIVRPFRDVAELYIAAHEPTWKSPVHRKQWSSTLDAYVFPIIGDMAVSTIETADVLRVLEPIWHEKPETAARLRGRVETVLSFAASKGWREDANPARWRGHLSNLLPARAKVKRAEHHAAEPWATIAAFMSALRDQPGGAALALQFTILSAARTGEAIGARWDEIDLEARAWTVPGDRMKAGRAHRVALSEAACAILCRVRVPGEDFVLPGGKPGRPLSNMAMLALLARMGRDDPTVHGFRSTFRDWAAEGTHHPAELAEAALAHVVKDKVVAAYQRGDLFEKRRVLMDDWAAHCGVLQKT